MISKEFVSVSAFQYRDMRVWCQEHLGPSGYQVIDGQYQIRRWDSWSQCDNLTPVRMMQWRGEAFFDFADEKDYTWFTLRWS
jgi:hypothetical protein